MAYLGDTGQGGTVAFSVNTGMGRIRNIDLPAWTLEAIEAQALVDTGFVKKIPGDLADAGAASTTAIFDATKAPPAIGVVEELTVTFPIGDPITNDIPATFVGSGFLTNVDLPNMELNTLMEYGLEFTYDADSGPTYVPEDVTPPLSELADSQTIEGDVVQLFRRHGWHLATHKIVPVAQYAVVVNGVAVGLFMFTGVMMYFEAPDPIMEKRVEAALLKSMPELKDIVSGSAPVVPAEMLTPKDVGLDDGDLA